MPDLDRFVIVRQWDTAAQRRSGDAIHVTNTWRTWAGIRDAGVDIGSLPTNVTVRKEFTIPYNQAIHFAAANLLTVSVPRSGNPEGELYFINEVTETEQRRRFVVLVGATDP